MKRENHKKEKLVCKKLSMNNYLIKLDKEFQQVIWTIGTLDSKQLKMDIMSIK